MWRPTTTMPMKINDALTFLCFAAAIPTHVNVGGWSTPHIISQRHNPSITSLLRLGRFPVAGECLVTNCTQEIGLKIPRTCLQLMIDVCAWRTPFLYPIRRIPTSIRWMNLVGNTTQGRIVVLSIWRFWLHHQISCRSVWFNESPNPEITPSRWVPLIPR